MKLKVETVKRKIVTVKGYWKGPSHCAMKFFKCSCDTNVIIGDNFCFHCGSRLDWQSRIGKGVKCE